jgi:N-acyl-D-aspartate/D-glutamate deacylase
VLDILIKNGRIVDGSGSPWVRGDVGIKDGRIVLVRPWTPREAEPAAARVIDAEGLCVAPGFIDIHTHSEMGVLAKPESREKIFQGVTTEILGNCGMSASPVLPANREMLKTYVSPVLGHPEVDWTWTTLDEYYNRVEEQGCSLNVGTFIGLGTIRCAVMGFAERQPTASEMAAMKQLLAGAMEDGALGVSTGLVYAPGSYADNAEIAELSAVAAGYGGIYTTHMRDQGDHFLESIAESIAIGRKAQLPVVIAHHKVVGKANWGKVNQSLQMLDEARAAGQDVSSDVYPYLAGASTMVSILPSWVVEGGMERMLERLADPAARQRIKDDWATGTNWDNRVRVLGWENLLIGYVSTARNEPYAGLSLQEAARRAGKEPADFVMDLLLEEDGVVGYLNIYGREEDVRMVMRHHATVIGSDGLHTGKKPHPRLTGTFPRILGRYVREEHVLGLEEAVRKMTWQTAQRLGLRGIGLLAEGYRADITLFNPDTVIDRSTFEDPWLAPAGIECVIVGGRVVAQHGSHTGERPGIAVRRGRPLVRS